MHTIFELVFPLLKYLSFIFISSSKFAPHKDYEANRLESGLLYLAAGSHLLCDETQMQPGTLLPQVQHHHYFHVSNDSSTIASQSALLCLKKFEFLRLSIIHQATANLKCLAKLIQWQRLDVDLGEYAQPLELDADVAVCVLSTSKSLVPVFSSSQQFHMSDAMPLVAFLGLQTHPFL